MGFKLSSSLDIDAIRQGFKQTGYAHIPRVLPDENAKRIRKAMLDSTT